MANPDQLILVRGAVAKALKASADLATYVPAASIYGGTVPATRTFPFVRLGSMISTPFRASGLDSSAYRITVQGFAKDLTSGNTVTLKAEDVALLIGNAFKSALDDVIIPLSGGMKARFLWIQTIPIIDGDDTSAWMVTGFFNCEVSG